MKTNVLMKRPLFNVDISQRTDNEFLSATDLVRAGNIYRLSNRQSAFSLNDWFRTVSTKSFMEELKSEFGKIKISSTGKNKHTWLHPLLFIDLALSLSPKLKVETYKWLYDELIKNRRTSCDSYNRMSGALYFRHGNKATFPTFIRSVAMQVKSHCQVLDWQTCTERDLKLRDTMHSNITLLAGVLQDNNSAVRIGIDKALHPD